MKYFSLNMTSQELVKLYRKLAMLHHPDRNPGNVKETTRIMQEINAEFELALKQAKRAEAKAQEQQGRERAAKEGFDYRGRVYNVDEIDQLSDLLRQKIQEVIHLEGITVELCGSWIWITGDTRPVKEKLRAAEYFWASKKQAWYFKGCESRGNGKFSLDNIRSLYGSVTFKDGEPKDQKEEKGEPRGKNQSWLPPLPGKTFAKSKT